MANAFQMFLDLRDNIGERFSQEEHWTDRRLLSHLNAAQDDTRLMYAKAPGDYLVTSVSVTPSSSKITLPTDCARPVYLEQTANGYPIPFGYTVRERRVSRPVGSSITDYVAEGYFEDLYITINQDSFTDACTLWYEKRIPMLSFGVADSTSSTTNLLQFDKGNDPVYVDDHYNNAVVETMDTTDYYVKTRSTITDYTASTRLAAFTGADPSDDYYGTISMLPEEAHELIVLKATVNALSKASSSIDPKVKASFKADERDARKELEEWLSSRNASTGRIRETGDY